MNEKSDPVKPFALRLQRVLEMLNAGAISQAKEEFEIICNFSQANPSLIGLKRVLEAIRKKYNLPRHLDISTLTPFSPRQRADTEFCIVTPAFNSAQTLDETIRSVVSQKGQFQIRYHVQDGGSADETLEILKCWERRINTADDGQLYQHVFFSYESARDAGMYDAIVKGFDFALKDVCSKAWMGWINSDDQIDEGAFQFLSDVDKSHLADDIEWITGMISARSEDRKRNTHNVPISSEIIKNGLCDGKHWQYVQQEGTFWRKFVWEDSDAASFLLQHKLAGDWRLWFELSKKRNVYQALRPLGIFNKREGQLSQTSLHLYNQEIDGVASPTKRAEKFRELVGDTVATKEVIRVDSSGEILVTNRYIRVAGKKKISSLKEIRDGKINGGRSSQCKIDPYFLKAYDVSEISREKGRLGIIVFGHTRVDHIEAVLKSLASQGCANITNVWIDGHQGKQTLIDRTQRVADVAQKYNVNSIVRHNGQLGFRKILIQGLIEMSNRYESIIVLEDDCYPTSDAVDIFSKDLELIAQDPEVFSVYGHYFLTPSEGDYITRFQSWGWATTSVKLRPILHQLIDCFSMSEKKFLEFISLTLTDEIKEILDVTPPRNPSVCLERFFAWDETVALLTGLMGMKHMKASKRIVYNIGLDEGEHFSDKPIFRLPPFNMLTLKEVLSIESCKD